MAVGAEKPIPNKERAFDYLYHLMRDPDGVPPALQHVEYVVKETEGRDLTNARFQKVKAIIDRELELRKTRYSDFLEGRGWSVGP